jgi:hypothetical protein
MTMTKLLKLSLAALAATAAPVLAHGGDHPMHGGQVLLVGETAFELVGKPAGAELYVVEDGDDIAAAGYTAKLTVDAAGKKTDYVAAPAGGNRFVAEGAKLPKGAKVGVLLINTQSKARQMATFAIK